MSQFEDQRRPEAISPIEAAQRLVQALGIVRAGQTVLLEKGIRHTPAYALSFDSLEDAMPLVRQAFGTQSILSYICYQTHSTECDVPGYQTKH